MTIRVLHVAEAAGGVERYLRGLFKYTSQDVENILLCSQNYDKDKFRAYAKKIIQIEMAHDINRKKDIRAVNSIKAAVKQYHPDIVYAHSSKAGALTRLACLFNRVPVIYNPHGWAFNMQQSQKKVTAYKLIERIQAPFTKKIVCISEAEKQSAIKNKICSKEKLSVITNGVDIDYIQSAPKLSRKELGIPENAVVIGQIGRLSPQKAPDIFVKMATLVKKEIPHAFFVMVGDGELRDEIWKLIKSKHLEDSFLITGWVENPTIYLKNMDVATLLSRWEGFGLAIAEYMCAGVPLVATNVDAIPYVVSNGVDGILVEKDDFEQAAKNVIEIEKDKKLANKLIKNGLVTVTMKYSVRRVCSEMYKLYNKITKER
jgi:glycosyltransferase involved in cell wall biosynthesis